jgi:hypothetical protein
LGCVLRPPGGGLFGRTPKSDTIKKDFMMFVTMATVRKHICTIQHCIRT